MNQDIIMIFETLDHVEQLETLRELRRIEWLNNCMRF